MNVTVHTYNPATEKVVPKDAVVLTDHDLRHFGAGGRSASLLNYANSLDRNPGVGRAAATLLRIIAEQVKPPRIPEPGLWGVVKAGHEHLGTGRSEFVRVNLEGDFQWVDRTSEADWSTWDRLEDPTLVRDGIEVAS